MTADKLYYASHSLLAFFNPAIGQNKTDQPDDYAFVVDFHFLHEKAYLRPGMRKNQETGYTKDVSSLFSIHLGGQNLIASIENGVLTTYLSTDVLEGHRRYYTVGEVAANFTLSSLTAHDVNDLIEGNE